MMPNRYNRVYIKPSFTNRPTREMIHYFPIERNINRLIDASYIPQEKTILRRRFVEERRRDEERNTNYVISWWGQIWEPQKTLLERIIWIMIVIIVTSIWLYQVTEHIIEFLNSPPLVKVDYVNNDTLQLPSIILCPLPLYMQPSIIALMKKHFSDVDRENISNLLTVMDVSKLWDEAKIDSTSVLDCTLSEGIDIFHDEMYAKKCHVTEMKTTSGTCFLIKNEELMKYAGTHTRLHLKINSSERLQNEYYQLYLIHQDDLPLAHFTSAIHGYFFEYNNTNKIYIRFQELSYLNRRKKRCITGDESSECLERCIEEKIYSDSHVDCKLPYMENFDKKLCSSATEFQKIFDATNEVMNKFNPSQCDCPRQCLHIFYKTDYVTVKPSKELLDVIISCSYNSILLISEYRKNNNFIEFLSDVGGTLGLFLGICILNLFEILDGILRSFRRFCKRQLKRNISYRDNFYMR